MKARFTQILTIFLFIFYTPFAFSQDCGCNHIVNQSGIYRPATEGTGSFYLDVKPGQTICVMSGNYTELRFFNISGTVAAPIQIINCGGQVNVNSSYASGALIFENCQNFVVSGTGTPSVKYGFLLQTTGNGALVANKKSTNFEIENVEIASSGFAGMMLKTDPNACDSSTWRGNFVMNNVRVHDNYIHDVGGEGLYIGNSFWNVGYNVTCNGNNYQAFPHEVTGLKVYNNHIQRTGADGIQYGCARDAEVYSNLVEHTGLNPFANFQNNGIQCGAGSGGRLYNNVIRYVGGAGIIVVGHYGNNTIYNNIIKRTGGGGIYANDNIGSAQGSFFRVINNTITHTNGASITLANQNNVITVANNALLSSSNNTYIEYQDGASAVVYSNYSNSLSNAILEDTTNYRIAAGSPLIDAGWNAGAIGILFDREGRDRQNGTAYDIGASERLSCVGKDKAKPMLSNCPSKIVAYTTGPGVIISWTPPTAVDNCSAVSLSSNYLPNNVFPVGTRTVVYTARDVANNSITCSFSVSVTYSSACRLDTVKPVIKNCPRDTILYTLNNQSVVNWVPPSVSDNCLPPTMSVNYYTGSIFPIGTRRVIYIGRDANNNTKNCEFNVTVVKLDASCNRDSLAPTITNCPRDTTAWINNNTGVVSWAEPIITDNCGLASISKNYAPGQVLPIGLKTVKYIARDRRGNISDCTFAINVKRIVQFCDTERIAPVIRNCPRDTNINVAPSVNSINVNWVAPTATDNCSTPTLYVNYAPNTAFPAPSRRQIAYVARDARGNLNYCRFYVNITKSTGGGSLEIGGNNGNQQGDLLTPPVANTLEHNNTVLPKTYSIKKQNEIKITQIAPNPTAEHIHLMFYSQINTDIEVKIIDVNGHAYKYINRFANVGINEMELDVYDLPNGNYSIMIQTKSGETQTVKFVKI